MVLLELKNFPYYYAGSDGNIYSKRGMGRRKDSYENPLRCLKKGISSSGNGYYQVNLPCEESSRGFRSQLVHRIIAEAFLGSIPEGLTVSHLDGNKHNNQPSNLVVETHGENIARKKEHGTTDNGYRNSRAKLDQEQLKLVRQLLQEGELTHKEIGQKVNVSRTFITKINNGYRYKNQ